jgi:hypothetical protein
VPTQSVNKSKRIIRTYILAPSYVPVRTDQNELALVQRGDAAIVDIDHLARDAASRGICHDISRRF